MVLLSSQVTQKNSWWRSPQRMLTADRQMWANKSITLEPRDVKKGQEKTVLLHASRSNIGCIHSYMECLYPVKIPGP